MMIGVGGLAIQVWSMSWGGSSSSSVFFSDVWYQSICLVHSASFKGSYLLFQDDYLNICALYSYWVFNLLFFILFLVFVFVFFFCFSWENPHSKYLNYLPYISFKSSDIERAHLNFFTYPFKWSNLKKKRAFKRCWYRKENLLKDQF